MRAWASISVLVGAGVIVSLFCFSTILPLRHNPEIVLAASSALQPYGKCAAPPQEGVNFCLPYNGAGTPGPVQVIAAGTSGRGRVNNMQLWVDGKKVMQTAGSPFDQAVNLPEGWHELTVVEVDETGFYAKSSPQKVCIGGYCNPSNSGTSFHGNSQDSYPCPLPNTPGVNICTPNDGSCQENPWLNVAAVGRGETGPVVRMELWIHGVKIANFNGDHFDTNLADNGTAGYTDIYGPLEVWEVDSHGHALKAVVHLSGIC